MSNMKRRNIKLRSIILPLLALFLCFSLFIPLFTAGSESSSTVTSSNNSEVTKPNSKLPSSSIGSNLPVSGKLISFLGDSITTYEGWSNDSRTNGSIGENSVYYDESKMPVASTWWHQLTRKLGLSLCVNNSWNGGRVTEKAGTDSGVTRAGELHNDTTGVEPHIIVVYMGTNDVANDVALEDFESAYSNMLNVIKVSYPDAKVYTCTILPESRTVNKAGEVANYNASIRSITRSYGYEVIDFASELSDWDYTTETFVDGTLRVHPTAAGMDRLTDCAYEVMKNDT